MVPILFTSFNAGRQTPRLVLAVIRIMNTPLHSLLYTYPALYAHRYIFSTHAAHSCAVIDGGPGDVYIVYRLTQSGPLHSVRVERSALQSL